MRCRREWRRRTRWLLTRRRDELDAIDSSLDGARPAVLDQDGLELDEPSVHIVTPWVVGQHTEDIASIAGAHAEEADGTGGRAVDGGADESLHNVQALYERPVALVAFVPLQPLGHEQLCGTGVSASAACASRTRSSTMSAAGLISLTTLQDSPAQSGASSMSPSKSGVATPTA